MSGVVRDSAGNPVGGEQVALVVAGTSTTVAGSTTGGNGAYSLQATPGQYQLWVDNNQVWGNDRSTVSHFNVKSQPFNLTGSLVQDLTIPYVSYDVSVVDGSGAPVVGASVTMPAVKPASFDLFPGNSAGNGDSFGGNTTTDSSGVAHFRLLPGPLSDKVRVTPPSGSGLAVALVSVPQITASSQLTVILVSNKAATTTALASSANPSAPGQAVTYTATVSPAPDGGTAAFTDGTTAITGCGTQQVDATSGKATCTVTYTGGGTHAITAAYSGDASYQASTSTQLTQVVTAVTQASQSISFPATGVTYGQADFSPATANSGLSVSYSQPSGQCQVDSQGLVQVIGAGSCTITASQPGNKDYLPAPPVTQTFSIAKATLSVDPSPASEVYAATPATLTYTLSGFVNGDTAATSNITGTASCSIATGTGTDAGAYPGAITCTPGTLTAPNYTFTAGQAATLTITQASQSVTFTTTPPASPVYGGSYTPAATATSGLPVAFSIDTASSNGACQLSSGTVSFTGTGTCVIDATQSGNTNYSSATAQQTLHIAKKPLTVTADPYSKLFGAANPPLTATITGFAFGQTLQTSGVTGQPSCTTIATTSSPAGTYPITCTQGTLAAANYSFTFTPGTLTITATKTITGDQAGPLTITAGQSVLIGPGATVTGPVTVQSGGALEVEGGTITGPLRSTAATGLRFCNTTLTGPVTATRTSGLVVFGDDDGSVACAGNTINGPVSITGGTGGVEFDDNHVIGSLTITGNTGTLAPPDTGTVDATGNTVTGPTNIQK